jgi:hypothetical protein
MASSDGEGGEHAPLLVQRATPGARPVTVPGGTSRAGDVRRAATARAAALLLLALAAVVLVVAVSLHRSGVAVWHQQHLDLDAHVAAEQALKLYENADALASSSSSMAAVGRGGHYDDATAAAGKKRTGADDPLHGGASPHTKTEALQTEVNKQFRNDEDDAEGALLARELALAGGSTI